MDLILKFEFEKKKTLNSGDYYITNKKIKNIIYKYNLILYNKIKKIDGWKVKLQKYKEKKSGCN